MRKLISKVKNTLTSSIALLIVLAVAGLCAVFILCGTRAEDGSITLDGKPAVIEEYTEKFVENSNEALYRIMNENAPTDEDTIREYESEDVGLGAATTLDAVLARRKPDGYNDDGKGLQCSKYTAYLATGKMEYSSAHPDYGPVNGKDVAAWLVKYHGWKYTDTPVAGAIGSGGFNTKYGHTAMYLYATGTNTAMVNDANYAPLAVSTHNMNISGWVWVVPGSYEPSIEPADDNEQNVPSDATESPKTASNCQTWYVKRGDTMGAIMRACEGYVRYGATMRQYADKWISKRTGRSVLYGWTHGRGVGLYAGDVITRKGE
jgi:hypothetical protein